MTRYLILTVTALMLSLFASTRAFAATAEPSRFVTIPVFFITDRNLVKSTSADMAFGNDRQYDKVCKHDLNLGVAFCVVENNKDKVISDSLAGLGWKNANSGNLEHKVDVRTEGDYQKRELAFYSTLIKPALTTPDHELLVFVPGYMSSLDSGLISAARFAYDSERPVLLYSWASGAKLKNYFSDEANVEWSQDHFDHLISRLSTLHTLFPDQPVHVRLFAHSMGSRLVLRAVPLLRGNPAFREISLVCPDIDEGLFQHYVSKYGSTKGSANIRLYLSHKDKMLQLSRRLHGKHSRLGQTSLSAKEEDQTPKDTVDVTADLRQSNHRFQTIDFSDLDRGRMGHRIPVELI
jgi:esterase/lipase superfamily enzyme